jgi:hypothetical protein
VKKPIRVWKLNAMNMTAPEAADVALGATAYLDALLPL